MRKRLIPPFMRMTILDEFIQGYDSRRKKEFPVQDLLALREKYRRKTLENEEGIIWLKK